jgi:hypothetical protein
MKIICTHQGAESTHLFDKSEVILGRPNPFLKPDLDLTPDLTVSRTHARLWLQDGVAWIEDLASSYGTAVNGRKLTATQALRPGDIIRIGETNLRVDLTAGTTSAADAMQRAPAPEEKDVHVHQALNAEDSSMEALAEMTWHEKSRLAQLLRLPLQLAAHPDRAQLSATIIEKVVQLIPGAERGALLLWDAAKNELVLEASLPADEMPVSATLAARALHQGRAFIWRKLIHGVLSDSIRRLEMKTGMYAPLLWNREAIGVLCVDNPRRDGAFANDDLHLLMAAANYAASALARQRESARSRPH